MGEHDGLRDLQVRVAGHHDERVEVPRGLPHHHAAQGAGESGEIEGGLLHEEAEVGGDLIVAGARGVQLARDGADAVAQGRLDVHVDVLAVLPPLEGARADVLQDAAQALLDGGDLLGSEDARAPEHRDVREAAANVLLGEPLVEGDAGVEALDEAVGRFLEASAPQFLLVGGGHAGSRTRRISLVGVKPIRS